MKRLIAAVACVLLVATVAPRFALGRGVTTLGDYLVLCWNDLGMHCMNQFHANFSILPPYNNLHAQVIRRGDASNPPLVVTSGVQLEYSIPGNTSSVAKTDFWTYAPALFGLNLPPDIGLGGKGLTGTLDWDGADYSAIGIPVTPFPDASPTIEHPYQQALVIARAEVGGAELARSTPVVPVSVEIGCIGSGCHASEDAILNGHPREGGFDPAARPILCASCHADPALGAAGKPGVPYFSLAMHEHHSFMDEQFSGTTLCYKCHPGNVAKCLRGVMSTRFGLVCQDCHGTMHTVASSIDGGGRVPWVNEPRCGTCHASRFSEPAGQLFRVSTGHGGVMCEGCHNSTHAEWSSGVAADNANVIALQASAAPLGDCTVCHGFNPESPGPHGILTTDVASELLDGVRPIEVFPNPTHGACRFVLPGRGAGDRLIVYDSQGRIVRLLHGRETGAARSEATWDGLDHRGRIVRPGTYFVRWQDGPQRAAARFIVKR